MRRYPYFLVALLVVLFDQATKYVVRVSLDTFETIRVLPFFNVVHVRNEGAAFGLFKSLGNAAFIVVSVGALVLVTFLLLKTKEDRLSLSLILGGAIGNLIDRILFGRVTDFVDVFVGRFHWPAFNVADSALTVGLMLMLLRSLPFVQRKETA